MSKTAVSMRDNLLKAADALAKEMDVSRSQLFAMAVEEFIRVKRNREIHEMLNSAYQDGPDENETAHLSKMKGIQRRILEGKW